MGALFLYPDFMNNQCSLRLSITLTALPSTLGMLLGSTRVIFGEIPRVDSIALFICFSAALISFIVSENIHTVNNYLIERRSIAKGKKNAFNLGREYVYASYNKHIVGASSRLQHLNKSSSAGAGLS